MFNTITNLVIGDQMKRNSLFNRFIIQSIISFLITAGLLAYFGTKIIVSQEINHNIEIIRLTLGHSLEHWFEQVDLYHLSEEDISSLDEEFSSLEKLGNISDIRIWRLDGKLMYSNDKTLIGNLILEDEHFEPPMVNEVHYKLIEINNNDEYYKAELGSELIKIYLPIKHEGETKGIFEVYRSFSSSRDNINRGVGNILFILVIGFFLLYFFLLKVIYTSSNKLVIQNTEIMNKSMELSDSYKKLNNLYHAMVRSLSNAIDARDKYTSGHSQRVADQTVLFARYLNLEESIVSRLEIAALLHDIGKLGVSEQIINKAGKLTEDEFNSIKEHPVIGEKIIEDIEELQGVLDVLKYHHERYDGKGYPSGLSGKNIPYFARIVTITDSYDAMISHRPYRKGFSQSFALEEIINNAGTQFDPDLAKSFIQFIQE